MTRAPASVDGSVCDHDDGCITCGDTAIPLTVRQVDSERGLALCVNETGDSEAVEIGLVAPVQPGDSLLVHAGTALQRLGRATPGRSREAGSRELVSGPEAGSPAEVAR
jgi:hydrogenase maturation factor